MRAHLIIQRSYMAWHGEGHVVVGVDHDDKYDSEVRSIMMWRSLVAAQRIGCSTS